MAGARATRRQVVLIGNVSLSPSVQQLTWRACSGAPLRWLPGQHIQMRMPDRGERIDRYSIASADCAGPPGVFDIAIRTSATFKLGDVAELVGLQGEFVRRPDEEGPALFVGAGTGVAPLRAMVQALLKRKQAWKSVLLAGARDEEELLFAREFRVAAAEHRWFDYIPTLSGAAAAWHGRRGYAQVHLGEVLDRVLLSYGIVAPTATQLGDVKAYVCGPQAMVEACGEELLRLGLSEQCIVIERPVRGGEVALTTTLGQGWTENVS